MLSDLCVFFFKQKTAYEIPKRDWSSDVCSSDLYTANCATCHGKDGRGGDVGTNLVQNQILLRPADYNKILRDGRHRMPGFQKALSPAQEADILAWLLT